MKNIIFSIFCFYFTGMNSVSALDKIVGGGVVDPSKSETTHIVYFDGGCAGSVIAAKWILTAAHCEEVFKRYVTTGHVNLKSKERFKLEIKKGYIHPDYNSKTYSHDFALVELRYPIHFENMGIRKIEMLTPEMVEQGAIDAGVVATVMGWGSTSEGGDYSRYLLSAELPIVSHAVANATGAYNGIVDESMIPAGFASGKKDTCQGDSGGPFTIMGTNGRPVLAGIISWGTGCARANFYGLYANVAVGYDWIMKTINSVK